MNYTSSKIIGLLAITILLASLATAYAMWSETLKINVAINTGEVAVEWSDWACSDTGPDPQAPGFNNDEGKDVAQCIIEPEVYDDEGNVIKLNVTIVNAYPGYQPELYFLVDNIGTIPVKLLNYTISDVNTTALDVAFTTPEDTQIHPGGDSTYGMTVTVLQEAEENATYTFEVTLVFAQWNEVPQR